EDLQPMALAVDDVQILPGVDRQLVRQVPFTRSRSLVSRAARSLSDLLDELPVLVEEDDAVVAVTVSDDHVAAVKDGDPGRQVEMRRLRTLLHRRPELQQERVHLRIELDDPVRV